MTDFSRDPVHNAIHEGIKEDIRLALEHKRFRAAVLLIYAGMDAMSVLSMPATQDDVTGADFISWADRYIRFPCVTQVKGVDLYGARCSMLHTYGAVSKMSRQGKCRMIAYADHQIPEVRFNPSVASDLMIVSVKALMDAFFAGIDRFFVESFADKAKGALIEKRLQNFTMIYDRQPKDGST